MAASSSSGIDTNSEAFQAAVAAGVAAAMAKQQTQRSKHMKERALDLTTMKEYAMQSNLEQHATFNDLVFLAMRLHVPASETYNVKTCKITTNKGPLYNAILSKLDQVDKMLEKQEEDADTDKEPVLVRSLQDNADVFHDCVMTKGSKISDMINRSRQAMGAPNAVLKKIRLIFTTTEDSDDSDDSDTAPASWVGGVLGGTVASVSGFKRLFLVSAFPLWGQACPPFGV